MNRKLGKFSSTLDPSRMSAKGGTFFDARASSMGLPRDQQLAPSGASRVPERPKPL